VRRQRAEQGSEVIHESHRLSQLHMTVTLHFEDELIGPISVQSVLGTIKKQNELFQSYCYRQLFGSSLKARRWCATHSMIIPVLSKKSEDLCELSDTAMRLSEQPGGEYRPYRILLRSFSSMLSLRSSFIRESLGTGRYADPSARFQNETALSTQILRL
jgi:hypothetical protein